MAKKPETTWVPGATAMVAFDGGQAKVCRGHVYAIVPDSTPGLPLNTINKTIHRNLYRKLTKPVADAKSAKGEQAKKPDTQDGD